MLDARAVRRRSTVAVDGFDEKRSTCATYDSEGVFVLEANNSEGLASRAEYDRGHGVKIGALDANGLITRWALDGFGRVRERVNPDKTSSWSSLSLEPGCGKDGLALCTVITSETSGGAFQQVVQDGLGRTVRTISAGPDQATCSQAGVCEKGALLAVDEQYDHFGHRVQVSRPYILKDAITPKQYEEIEYDGLGREVLRTEPNGLVVETSYDGLTVTTYDGFQKTTTVHDGLGRIASVTDNLDTVTTYAYGPFGLLSRVQVDGASAETTTSVHDVLRP